MVGAKFRYFLRQDLIQPVDGKKNVYAWVGHPYVPIGVKLKGADQKEADQTRLFNEEVFPKHEVVVDGPMS